MFAFSFYLQKKTLYSTTMVSAIQILILAVAIGGVLSCITSAKQKRKECVEKIKHNKNPNIMYYWHYAPKPKRCECYGKACPKKRDITIRGRLTHPNRGGQMRAAVGAIGMKLHQLLQTQATDQLSSFSSSSNQSSLCATPVIIAFSSNRKYSLFLWSLL